MNYFLSLSESFILLCRHKRSDVYFPLRPFLRTNLHNTISLLGMLISISAIQKRAIFETDAKFAESRTVIGHKLTPTCDKGVLY